VQKSTDADDERYIPAKRRGYLSELQGVTIQKFVFFQITTLFLSSEDRYETALPLP
jgi:hypothetical protein